jgi:sodium pump decarboxylase gamma subunit
MADFVEAARVTVMGMGMVFATLGGLMLIIAGLQRVFRQSGPRRAAPSAMMASIPPLAVTPVVDQEDEVPTEVVAAIAVALAVLREGQEVPDAPRTSVVTFAPGTGAWRASGRLS